MKPTCALFDTIRSSCECTEQAGFVFMDQRDDWHLTELLHFKPGRSDPFAAAVRATRMPMVITDPAQADNPIVFANEAFQQLTGYALNEILGRNCRFLQGSDTDQSEVARIRDAILRGESLSADLLNYRKNGTTFWNALYLSPVRNDAGAIKFFFASQLDVTERVEAQKAAIRQREIIEAEVSRRTQELRDALDAKSVLLHEIDHRVKNNLMMIGSLLRLQSRQIGDPVFAARLNDMLVRVETLASVHRQLYQSDNLRRFDIGALANTLLSNIVGSSGRTDIATEFECEPLDVSADLATPLGLILNEIITNSVKHAFRDDRGGKITLSVTKTDGNAVIRISDDGPGFTVSEKSPGLGRTLIKRLCKQVGAAIRWVPTDAGTTVEISLPVKGE
jgi:PAS domain S-box-containing protein